MTARSITITIAIHFYMLSTDELLELANKETFGKPVSRSISHSDYFCRLQAKLTITSGIHRTNTRALLVDIRTRVNQITYVYYNIIG